MADTPGIAGQIMHSPTVEKIIQPAEAKGEVAAQHAAAESDQALEQERRAVGRVREAEGGRVEEDSSKKKQDQEKEQDRKRKAKPARPEDEEQAEGQGRYIDLKV